MISIINWLLFELYSFTAAKQAVEHDSAGRVQDAIYYYELSVDLLKGMLLLLKQINAFEK